MSAAASLSSEVTFASLANGGEAVGRLADGRVIFVPGGAPGDRARVEVVERRKDYARGRLLEVLEAGESRVTAACALAGTCGGCPWMHVAAPAQRAAKEDQVRRALRALPELEVLPLLTPTPALGYRLRARLTQRDGRLGYLAQRSHEVVSPAACPVLEPALERALFAAGGAVAALRGLLGEEGTLSAVSGAGQVHLALRFGPGENRVMARAALERLLAAGVIAGAALEGEDAPERLGAAAVNIGGAQPLWAAAEGFAQASAPGHDLLPRLVAEAVGLAPDGERWAQLLELHAGSGNLSRWLRPRCQRLVAIEFEAPALLRLRALFAEAERAPTDREGRSGPAVVDPPCALTTYAEPAERCLQRLTREERRFPVVVLDPPRGGAAAEVALLPQLAPERVVYVSCDPMTLARDLRALRAAGYRPRWVQPIDLMPHTPHVELVALVDRDPPAR